MATAVQLRLPQGKDAVIDLEPVWRGNAVYDLTDVTLTAWIKPSADVPDDDPGVAVITAVAGANGVITVTDAVNGLATLTISGSVISSPGTLFWHVDAADETGSSGTVAYGPVYVEDT